MRKKKFVCYKGSDEGVQVRRSIPLKESPQKIEVKMSISIHSPAEDLLSGVPLFKADLIKIIEYERASFYMSRGMKRTDE